MIAGMRCKVYFIFSVVEIAFPKVSAKFAGWFVVSVRKTDLVWA